MIETKLLIALDEDIEKYESGVTKEPPTMFPTPMVLDIMRDIYFYQDADMSTVINLHGEIMKLGEKFADFREKYIKMDEEWLKES